jgi:hypothetical protein
LSRGLQSKSSCQTKGDQAQQVGTERQAKFHR